MLLASYAWWEDGTSLLTKEAYPEEYVVPLWEGCLVLAGYCGGLGYNASTGEAAWEQYDDAPGRIRLEYVAPLVSSESAKQAAQMPEGEFEVPPGTYVVGEDFPAGAYTIKHADGESLFNIDVDNADGRSVFNDGFWASKGEYLGKIELLDGFSVKIDQGVALFVPYKGLFATTAEEPDPTKAPVSDDPYLLYEDENIAVSYSNFYVERIGDSSYLKTELLLKNKTDRILNIGCDSVIVNGCAVDISKFVEVPADCTFLHEWTNGAEMFLKYRIDTVETFAMVFEYHNADSYFAGESIQTRDIEIE